MDTITWIWFIVGTLLIVSEIAIPGAVVAFLGAGAVLIALGRWGGLIEGLMDSFMYWFVLSMGMILLFRGTLTKLFPSESHVEYVDEDLDAFGEIAEVVEEISYEHEQGRIRHRGSTWAATTADGVFAPGDKVKLIDRTNLVWWVEACPTEEQEAYMNKKAVERL